MLIEAEPGSSRYAADPDVAEAVLPEGAELVGDDESPPPNESKIPYGDKVGAT